MTYLENKQVKLSVIIAAWNGISLLRECLSSLENQTKENVLEVIVVSNFEKGISESKAQFPFAKHFVLPSETTVPQLRSYGITQARGAIVALVEDLCLLDSAWCQEIEKAYASQHAIVGGSVENASREKALDWAVYFYDYGKYMLPNETAVTNTLSGLNTSYKKEVLELVRDNYKDGFFETFINEELKQRGFALYIKPSIIVYHNKSYDLRKTVLQFYHQARSFAARRASKSHSSTRLLLASVSPILPILLPMRIISQTVSKGRHFKELVIALPIITILMLVWAFGELCGYLMGEGESERQWK